MNNYLPDLIITDEEGLCGVCSNLTKTKCSACGEISYCSTDHQNADWEKHRGRCSPYKILRNDTLGRYAVAVRDLLPGEVIVRECPVTVGPKHYSPPVCLGCLTPITSLKELRLCSKCGWPTCCEKCEQSEIHAENECPIFASARIRFLWNPTCIGEEDKAESTLIPDNPMLQCITPLRLLLAKERDVRRWEKEVAPMEAHMVKRFNTDTWKSDMVNVSGFLRKACHLSERFSDEDVMWACGILQVNAFEARSGQGGKARCLYPRLAIFSHSCTPNIIHAIDAQFNMVGRVSVPVSQGQLLNTCYTYKLSTTLERRECLRQGNFFDCLCKRCIDPTELGTDFSTILCKKCPEGKVLPKDPIDPKSAWMCTECGDEKSVLSVELLLESLEATPTRSRIKGEKRVLNLNNPQELEEAIQRCSFVLHPNHSLITNLKVSLVQIYGNTVKFPLKDCLPLMLEHKVKLCQDILKVADIIEPGLSRLRGTIIYEMCEPLEMLEKYKLSNGLESYSNYCKNLIVVEKCLEEAVSMLSLEAPDSPEAEMCLKAKARLYNVQKIINDNFTQPDIPTENKKLTSLLEVFEDYNLSLNSNKNKLIDAKEKDQKMLSEFVKEIEAANIQTSTTSSDLTDIIEILKEEGQEDSFGDLQIFEEMIKTLKITKEQNGESCTKLEDKKFL